jgi:hypothetical protein
MWGYTGGIKAPPGIYTASFTASGVTQRREVRVLPDPRTATLIVQADHDAMLGAALAVRDSLDVLQRSLAALRSLKAQATTAVELAAALGTEGQLKGAADTLKATMAGVEERFTQVKSESGQDPIRHAGQLDNQLLELYGNLTGSNGYISGSGEGRPRAGALERLGDLNKQWGQERARYEQILRVDVPRFNERAQRAGVGPLVVPVLKPKIAS